MNIPLLADTTLEISRTYGVLKEDEGIAFRYCKYSFDIIMHQHNQA